MPKTSAAPAWLGAPPVSADGFAFANGELFAEASGQNRHRRATQAELKTLMHYGLQPSKTKSVARMRLFDAVNAGKLAVPVRITKLEGELKKEWTKKDREAKKGLKGASVAETKKTTATEKKTAAAEKKTAGVKRKAEAAGDSSKQSAPKKAKTAATPKKTPATKAASDTKAASATPATKQTARCRRGGISQGPSRGSTSTIPPSPALAAPRTKQTARRGNAIFARDRIAAPVSYGGDAYGDLDDESPPPYSEYDEDDEDGDTYGEDVSLAPLGLLNGSYDISCPYVTSEWPFYGSDFEMTLTLAGRSLWGSFDLGVIEGVLHFDERPWESSHDSLSFTWRGRENEGPIFYGNRNSGWIKFLGDGRIEGGFDYQRIAFRGKCLPGQGTRSEIDAYSMQSEWDGYSEAEYERENQSRWR